MKFIHYTDKPINSLEPRDYSQADLEWQSKPNGLWFSVEEVGKHPNNYNWREWCEAKNYQVGSLVVAYEIVLKEDTNILHLKTAEKIKEFTKQYLLKTRDGHAEWGTYQLEWNEVKKKHSGIIISPYQWDCRLSLETGWYYGWDCSSGCIWDVSCIKEFVFRAPHRMQRL
jgi:hypothetical protein